MAEREPYIRPDFDKKQETEQEIVNARNEAGWLHITVNGKPIPKQSINDILEIPTHETYKYFKVLGILKIDNINYILDYAKNEKRKFAQKYEKIKLASKEVFDFIELVDRFLELQPIYFSREELWWFWNYEACHWELTDKWEITNLLQATTDNLKIYEQKTQTEFLNALKMRARLKKPQQGKPTWIQFAKKIHDIETGEEFDSTPKYFMTNPIPWELGESTETPEMDKLFQEWVEEKYVNSLYEILAFCTLTSYPLHRIFCLHGEGRNGKGSYLQILEKFIGENNIAATSFDALMERTHESANLYKKLVCTMGEINSTIFKKTDIIKKLSGQDLMRIEFKFKNVFSTRNYAKLLIATNKLPETSDKTKGFYSRWLTIDFPNTFQEKTNLLSRIPEQEYKNLAKKSLDLVKLILQKGKFENEGTIEERMERYEERASPIREFLLHECIQNQKHEIPFWKFYEEYASYCDQRNFRKPSKGEVSRILTKKKFQTKRTNYFKEDGEKSTMIIVLGITLKSEMIETEPEKIGEPQNTGQLSLQQTYPRKENLPAQKLAESEKTWHICSYCGEHKWLEYQDIKGNYHCQECNRE